MQPTRRSVNIWLRWNEHGESDPKSVVEACGRVIHAKQTGSGDSRKRQSNRKRREMNGPGQTTSARRSVLN